MDEVVKILEFYMMHPLKFLKTNPYNQHLVFELYADKYHGIDIEQNSSCLWVPSFFKDLFSLPIEGHVVFNQESKDVISVFKPLHIYEIDSYSHCAIVIYLDPGNIFYIDFYSETGRLRPFRVERISHAKLANYVQAAIENNVAEFVKFHRGTKDYQRYLDERYSDFDLMDRITEYEITYLPRVSDILRVVMTKTYGLNQSEDYFEEDFSGLETDVPVEEAKMLGYQILLEEMTMLFDSCKMLQGY